MNEQETFDPAQFDPITGEPIMSPENMGKVDGATDPVEPAEDIQKDGSDENYGAQPQNDGRPIHLQGTPKQVEDSQENSGIADEIARELAEDETARNDEPLNQAEPVEPIPFDFSKLSPDDLQRLKAMLNATPDRVVRKKQKPVCRIKEYEGKLVLDFKNAFVGVVHDYDLHQEVQRQMIPILLDGAKEFKNIRYREFRNLPEVVCEIMQVDTDVEEVEEGTVVSKLTGREVPMVKTVVSYSYRIRTPDGKDINMVKLNH